MKNISRPLFIILILSGCVNVPQRTAENIHRSSFYPFIISKGEAELIDITYKIIGHTKSIPPHYIKKIDKYVYRIAFTFHIKDEVIWDQPFLLIIQFPDKASETIVFNGDEFALTDSKSYQYFFTLAVDMKQKIIFTLGYWDENGDEIFDFDNPFQTIIVALD